MTIFRAVFFKELIDAVRDRRSILAALVFAVVGPVLVAMMITITAGKRTSQEPVQAVASGLNYAPALARHLESEGVIFKDRADVELIIPDDFAARFNRGETVAIEIRADRSRTSTSRDADRLGRMIDAYASELGLFRLQLRGVSPSVIRPMVVDGKDTATPEARAAVILGLLGIYFLLAAFIGSAPVAIDSSAGERERNSLEVLMAQPVSPIAIFAGKWATATVFGILGIGLAIIASKLAFIKVPLTTLGLNFSIDATRALLMLGALLPLAGFAAALQMSLAMWAKTFKEASAYLNMLSFIPALVAMVVLIQEIEPEGWMFAVPILGHQQMLNVILRADEVAVGNLGLLILVTAMSTALIVYMGSRLLRRERIVFGQLD